MLGLLAIVSRRFSVGEFGAFNLGLVLYQYALMLTDFGTRSIGGRLIAIGQLPEIRIVSGVWRKRIQLFVVALGIAALYLVLTPTTPRALLLFAAAALFAGMSHEWIFWAQERYWRFAAWRSFSGLLVFFVVGAAAILNGGLLSLALGYAGAMAAGMALSWAMSAVPARWVSRRDAGEIEALHWREISLLGFALVANQLFQTGDVMLLGVLSDQNQLGIYGAASRLILFLFGVYYLGAQALYPWLARQFAEGALDRRTAFSLLGGAGLCGLGLGVAAYPFLGQLVGLAFGRAMVVAGAPGILKILVFVLPLELVMGTWGMMATAAGFNRLALKVTSLGALTNFLLNIFLIPGKGAVGAALASLLSYGIVVGVIILTLSTLIGTRTMDKRQFSEAPNI